MRLKLSHPGVDQRVAELHLHYYLLADILAAMAQAFTEAPPVDDAHRGELLSATATLQKALRSRRPKSRNRARTGRAA